MTARHPPRQLPLRMIHLSKTKPPVRGWTFVELLVGISLSAIFLGAASLVLASISTNSKRLASIVEVPIGQANKQALYGESGGTVSTYSSPCFGRAAIAQDFREFIREDAEVSALVHCLPRALPNTIRPEFLSYPAGEPGSTAPHPRLDTPEAFRQFLAAVAPASATVYDTPIRNIPPANRPNTTVFLLGPSEDPAFLRVRAIYEIDHLATASPAGTYATVRRFRNGVLTHHYDVFYETGPGSLPLPGFAAFERTARRTVAEGDAIDRFKIAEWSPFYLLWLPDPSINPHKIPNTAPAAPPTAPLSAYESHGQRTSMQVVIPMFPGL